MNLPLATGALGVVGVGVSTILSMQDPATPVLLVPAINLTAIILGSIAMGSMFNRVKQLERRMDKVQRRVFHEEPDGAA